MPNVDHDSKAAFVRADGTVRRVANRGGGVLVEQPNWRWVGWVVVVAVLVGTSINMLRPFVSYRALEFGASPAVLGAVVASYALIAVFIAVPLGRVADRWGEPLMMVIGTALVAGGLVVLPSIGGLWGLGAVNAIVGAGHIMFAIGTQTIIANAEPSSERDRRIASFTIAASVGQLIGPALGGYLATRAGGSSTSVFLTAGFLALAAALMVIRVAVRPPPREPRVEPRADENPRGVVSSVLRTRGVPQALLTSLTVLASVDILIAYLPAYGDANGIPVATVGLMLSLRAAASIASRLFIQVLMDRLGRRLLLLLSMLLPAIAISAMALTTETSILIVLVIIAGLGLGLGQPLSLMWIVDRLSVDVRGTAIGLRISGNRVGQLVIPSTMGTIAGAAGPGGVLVGTGVMLAASAVSLRRAELDIEETPAA